MNQVNFPLLHCSIASFVAAQALQQNLHTTLLTTKDHEQVLLRITVLFPLGFLKSKQTIKFIVLLVRILG